MSWNFDQQGTIQKMRRKWTLMPLSLRSQNHSLLQVVYLFMSQQSTRYSHLLLPGLLLTQLQGALLVAAVCLLLVLRYRITGLLLILEYLNRSTTEIQRRTSFRALPLILFGYLRNVGLESREQ